MSIFLVRSNLKLNGDAYTKGTFFNAPVSSDLNTLVQDGVLRQFDVDTEAEAKAIVASEGAEPSTEAAAEEKAPEDTWGAQKDPVVEAPKAGDECQLAAPTPDGISTGILEEQDGALVCVLKPIVEKKEVDTTLPADLNADKL